jgi:hypothetical protein
MQTSAMMCYVQYVIRSAILVVPFEDRENVILNVQLCMDLCHTFVKVIVSNYIVQSINVRVACIDLY